MISRYQDLLNLLRVDIPHCSDALLLQTLQQVGREFARFTEAWREKLDYNIVDSHNAYTVAYNAAIALGMSTSAAETQGKNAQIAARDYVIKPSYEAEIVRLWRVFTSGDETRPMTDPQSYRFDVATGTLTFNSDLQQYSPTATNWTNGVSYAVGQYVIQDSLRYICSIAHVAGTFATDLAAYRWQLMPNDIIVRAVLIPRVYCVELAAWFMEKWAEALVAGTKAKLMAMKNKNWSSPERVAFFDAEYKHYTTLACRERFTEDKSVGMTFNTPQFVR